MTEEEKAEMACDWADFRKDYAVTSRWDDSLLQVQHKAFCAGWIAGRKGEQAGVLT